MSLVYLRFVRQEDSAWTPAAGTFNLEGLDVSDEAMEKLFHVDRNMWTAECDLTEEYFDKFGERVPPALTEELAQLRGRLTT